MAKVRPLNVREPTENVAFGNSSRQSDRDQVQRAVQKFRELLTEDTKKSNAGSNKLGKKAAGTTEILRQMRKYFPSFCVNNTYAMLGEFGHVPGVDVGDCFSSRAELSLVGLHRPPQAGIDCKDVTFTRRDGNRELIAISLVVSGEYEDDSDQGHTIIYTGQGGKDQGAKQHSKDQISVGGNEALRNSKIRQIPIRVIRGRRIPGRAPKLFSYDGLFRVASYAFEKGQSNFKVFRFTLVRDKDQAPLLPLAQLLLKDGQGESGEGNFSHVVARVEVVSDEEEEATATDTGAATDTRSTTQCQKRLSCDLKDTVSNGEAKQPRLDAARALEGEKQVDVDDADIKDGEYEVDYILDKKTTNPRRGKTVTKYFVVWKGYPEEEGTWESVTNLTNCQNAIELFESLKKAPVRCP